jgi:urease accessory protein
VRCLAWRRCRSRGALECDFPRQPQLLPNIGCSALPEWGEISFPAAFTFAVAQWKLPAAQALVAYLWSWSENQVMAAVKAVPLGQTDAQKMLLLLAEQVTAAAHHAATIDGDGLGNFAPGLALLSARHETQYSRLFRS